ncbi:hypothetical protein [Campylobacter hyointestinalis]|uniref:hypothetical protein n=1 Tax=Campylobacter hyointestinalis TaxID=198 RepID=UPI000729CD04|nr:hypothetical protein [Campylobacter hyointestinalis]CUU74959.1 Uncharacterised protein [Campylobacter hyointestinalis subsp. hyointestinalis]CUU77703.1 Uncharacterised protein [Campylobacter hyointestinalis subsp. hyointestinalis]
MVVDHPLYKSLDILNKYKNELTKEQFDSISSIIYGFAIDENIYLNEQDIIDTIKGYKHREMAHKIIAQYKDELGVL